MTDVVKIIARDEAEKACVKGRLDDARRMLAKGASLGEIADLTDVSMEALATLRRTLQQ